MHRDNWHLIDGYVMLRNARDELHGEIKTGLVVKTINWFDKIFGMTWWEAAQANVPVAVEYMVRILSHPSIPQDDNVLLCACEGKTFLVHLHEITS